MEINWKVFQNSSHEKVKQTLYLFPLFVVSHEPHLIKISKFAGLAKGTDLFAGLIMIS